MTILLLGAGGFVGSHLVEHLLASSGHDVVGLDVTDAKLAGIRSQHFTFYMADVRFAPELTDDLISRADVVVDLIAYANPSIYVSAPLDVFELNFVQNLSIVKSCIRHRKRLIQYSSAEVYGKASEGSSCREEGTDSVFGPVSKQRWIYATSKLLLERLLVAHGAEGSLDFTIVRPFNFVGPRIDYLVPPNTFGGPRVFPHFMSALLNGSPLWVVDGGHVHRTFLHISDANTAFHLLLDNPDAAHNEIFNIGNPGNNITIRGLAELVIEVYEELTGSACHSEVRQVSGELFYGVGYEDGDRRPPDITKIRSLGWEPRHDLRSTLRETMRYYLEHADELVTACAPASAASRPHPRNLPDDDRAGSPTL
jgi:UDP-apiose/xylose synthase